LVASFPAPIKAGVYGSYTVTKRVVGVFDVFRAPLQQRLIPLLPVILIGFGTLQHCI
jgi:hypothetical protein